jgi:hypothetical protein
MWLYVLAFFILIFGIVGSVLSGGIFTIVLLPLGVIALISAVVFGAFGRAAQGRQGASTNAGSSTARPLPASEHSNTPAAPTTPDELAEARRVQQ